MTATLDVSAPALPIKQAQANTESARSDVRAAQTNTESASSDVRAAQTNTESRDSMARMPASPDGTSTIPVAFDSTYVWSYDVERPDLRQLYEKSKDLQW